VTLLERARELVELDGVIEAAGAGDGRLVVVEGPAGIGKTALVELVGERARAGGQRVLVARAGQLESSCSYGVVLQWLEREWRRSSGAGAAEVSRVKKLRQIGAFKVWGSVAVAAAAGRVKPGAGGPGDRAAGSA